MDVTKLFDLPQEKTTPLADERLDAMIERALLSPQTARAAQKAANQNVRPWKSIVAVAAAIALVVALTMQMQPATSLRTAGLSAASASDPYDEVSDLLMLEAFTVSSAN